MRRFTSKLIFFYSVIASFFIAISLALESSTVTPLIFAIFFLPIPAYFITELFNQLRSKSDITPAPPKGQVILLIIIFLALLGVGLRNIYSTSSGAGGPSTLPSPSSAPLIFKISTTPTPESSVSAQVKTNQ